MSFVPDRTTITGITQANPAVVTTSPDHGLSTGMVVRLVVPRNYGMYELNGLEAHVIVLSTSTFACYKSLVPTAVPIISTQMTAFSTPSNPGMLASCVPIGSGPTPKTTLAWQAQSNFCDSPLDDALVNIET